MADPKRRNDLDQIGVEVKPVRVGAAHSFEVTVTNKTNYRLSNIRLGIESSNEHKFNPLRSALGPIFNIPYAFLWKPFFSKEDYPNREKWNFSDMKSEHLSPQQKELRPRDPATQAEQDALNSLEPHQSRVMSIRRDPFANYRIGTFIECRLPGDHATRTIPLTPVKEKATPLVRVVNALKNNLIFVLGLSVAGVVYGLYKSAVPGNEVTRPHASVHHDAKRALPFQLPSLPEVKGRELHLSGKQKVLATEIPGSKLGRLQTANVMVECSLPKGLQFVSTSNIEKRSVFVRNPDPKRRDYTTLDYAVIGQVPTSKLSCYTFDGNKVPTNMVSIPRDVTIPVSNISELDSSSKKLEEANGFFRGPARAETFKPPAFYHKPKS